MPEIEKFTRMCPHCGWRFDIARGRLVPPHGCEGHAVQCPGTGQNPRNPESDKRPLWKDEKHSCRCKAEGPDGPIWCTVCGHDAKCCTCEE